MKSELIRNSIAVMIILAVLCQLLSSCSPIPPNRLTFEKELNESFEDFETVKDYFLGLEYDSASVKANTDNDDLTCCWADFGYHTITEENVISALERLHSIGCSYISKDTENNSISFELWWSSQDIGCGVLYQIDPQRKPALQFLTELNETEHDGWFTFVTNYNEWRSN